MEFYTIIYKVSKSKYVYFKHKLSILSYTVNISEMHQIKSKLHISKSMNIIRSQSL